MREPRLKHVHRGCVLANHPVYEKFEEQLSKPFCLQWEDHGTINGVLFEKKGLSHPKLQPARKVGSNETKYITRFCNGISVSDKILTR